MKNQDKKEFQGALILSSILHLILVGFFYFGFPSIFERLPEEQNVLTFEIVQLSEITNIKTESQSEQESKIEKKSKQVKASEPTPKKQEPAPEKTEEKKIEESQKKKEIVPIKKKKEPEKPKPKEKKIIKKKVQDPLDAILKNLDKESKGSDVKTPTRSQEAQEKGNKTTRSDHFDDEYPLSVTEDLYIKNLIKENWRQPSGFQYSSGVKIQVKVFLDKTGKILKSRLKDRVCPGDSYALCDLFEESIFRAIKKVDIIENLLPERYNVWKEFTLDFDSDFFNQ
jgi:outer membrane biosynthesis protein TonB